MALDLSKLNPKSKKSKSIPSTPSASKSPARPYHTWQGNNTICCDGRVIGGPQKRNFMYTLVLIIIPSLCFIGGVCVNYIREYQQSYVLIVYLLLLTASLISFALTAFSDPGIIPRGILPSDVPYKGPGHIKQRLCIGNKLVEIKWCSTCHVFRPPRSFHCYICNNCVERFDHHCPWIGNCIGLRNYAYFSFFVNSLQLVCVWALAHCIYLLYLKADMVPDRTAWNQFVYALKYEWMAFVVGVFVFIAMWFVIGLTWFHWFLVVIGKTTNEQLRNLHPAGSPFRRSIFGNISEMCCKLPKPSSVHLHHISPSKSNREMFINKHKVILLDQKEVKAHNEETHYKHIEDNSPFKQCLVANFGYKDLIQSGGSSKKKHSLKNSHKNSYKNSHSISSKKRKGSKLNGFMRDAISYGRHNGHDAEIEMADQIDQKYEEDASTGRMKISIDHGPRKVEEEEEENKYDDSENGNTLQNYHDKSRSRKDENIDQEHLYTAYDSDDEEDGRKLSLNIYNHNSRSVTPDYHSDLPTAQASPPPQPLLGGNTNTEDVGGNRASSKGKRKKKKHLGATSAVPSESTDTPGYKPSPMASFEEIDSE